MSNCLSHQQITVAVRARGRTEASPSSELTAMGSQTVDTPTRPPSKCSEKISILLIDDEAGIRTLLNNALLTQGYQCQEAGDGVAGLALWQTMQPDLVLLDITMPGLDGFEVLQEIRRCDPIVGVIMVSALNPERLADKGLNRAADGYVKKPFRTQTIFQEIERVSRLVRLRKGHHSFNSG